MPAELDFAKILANDTPQELTPPGGTPANDEGAPVEDTGEATAPPGDDAPAVVEDPEALKEPPGKSAAQRIADLTAKRRETERENQELREALARTTQGAPKEPTLAELHRSQFQTDEAYNDAVKAAALREATTQVAQTVAQERAEGRKEDFFGRLAKDGKGIDGFADVLEGLREDKNFIHISAPMAQYLMEDADHPANLVKWLADNPDEAERIFGLSATAATKELVRRDGLVGRKAGPPVSRAPAPTPSVTGSGSAPQSIERMSHDQLLAWTREQRRK